jgi:hypothetical protein
MKHPLVAIVLIALVLACGTTAARADGAALELGADRAIAGGSPTQREPVTGDLMAAGGNVDVLAEVGGDAILAGGTLRLEAPVGQDVYAAGGRVTLAAPVGRNARIAGGTLEIAREARIAGNVSAMGGEVRVLGAIDGYLTVAGGRVQIDAPVAGNVEVRAGHVELGPRAAIGGTLHYASRDELARDPAAQVKGGIERQGWPRPARTEKHVRVRVPSMVWTAGLMLLAAVLAAALAPWYAHVRRALTGRPGISALLGFAAIVCIPIGAIVLIATIIGAPLGLLVLLLYPVFLLVGYVSSAVVGGRVMLERWRSQPSGRGWQALAAALAMLVIGLVTSVPWVGWLITLAALLLGTGALLMGLRAAVARAA